MLAAAFVTWGLAAEASPSDAPARGPSFSLAYEGGGDCPSRASFEAAILARAPRARVVVDVTRAEVRFEARISTTRSGRLRVALDDGTSQDREIDADDCAEAVQSMAVIAAMILASREGEAAHEPAAAEPKRAAEPEPERVADEAAPRRALEAHAPKQRAARPTWLALGAGLGLEGAAAPDPLLAASAFIELGSVTSGVLAPSLRLSAIAGQAPDATATSGGTKIGDARFRLLLGRVHGCALRFGDANANLRACAIVEGGALFAQGIDALNERSATMGWLGAGLGASGGLRLGQRWTLELGGGARALFVRDEFVFAPSASVHQVPVFAWDSRLALAYRLW